MKERFFRNRTAVFTVVFVLLVGLVGILAPVIAPNDPYETNILNKFASYSLQYPLGTDQLGRCVLSRMIYGIRPTLGLALLTMFGTISLGAILGHHGRLFPGHRRRSYHACGGCDALFFPARSWCSLWWHCWVSASRTSSLQMFSSSGRGMPA